MSVMSPVKNQLADVIECLPEAELMLLLEIAKRFVSDDIASPDDIAAHEAAISEYKRGETVKHTDIDWS